MYTTELELAEYLKNKNIFLWGLGKNTDSIIEFLTRYQISIYGFIDSDVKKHGKIYKEKIVYSPNKLKNTENIFILIACNAFNEVSNMLEKMGFVRFSEYIDGVNIKNELCIMKYKDVPEVRALTATELVEIEDLLYEKNLNVSNISYDELDIQLTEKAFQLDDFYQKKSNPFYKRKICEYFFALKLLNLLEFEKEDIYIDVGSSSTPWVMKLRELYNITAYGVDLNKNPNNKDYYLQEDATNMSFADNSVKGISLQSTYCMFMGDADIKFIKECARVLKKGGKAVIAPLYLYTEYISLVSPQHYGKGYNDLNQKEYLRKDWTNIKMSRYYDVDNLKNRVIDEIERNGMKYRIYVLDNKQIPYYEFAYLKFILEIEK